MEDDLLKVFVQESKEHLDCLEPILLALEDKQDKESISAAFRAVHSIKGASGFFGLEKISHLSHQMENVMSLVRENKLRINKELTDALLLCTDKLKVMIDDVNNHNNVQIHNEINALRAVLEKDGDQAAPTIQEVQLASAVSGKSTLPENLKQFNVPPEQLNELLEQGKTFYVAKIIATKDNVSVHYFQELESLGDIADTTVDWSSIKGLGNFSTQQVVLNVLFSTLMQPDLVYLTFDVPADQIDEIDGKHIVNFIEFQRNKAAGLESNEKEKTGLAENSPSKENFVSNTSSRTSSSTGNTQAQEGVDEEEKLPILAGNAKKADSTIRVSVALLDDLMNLAGEMVLGRNQLMRLAGDLSDQIPGFASVLQQINLITSEMQEKVMLTRLQPINLLFNKFTRVVRDLSYKLNKDIRLKFSGKEVELDRSILEALSDPLMHIIRNCVDHGIENAKERELRGKLSYGVISLSAKHAGGQVHIEISDDGRGLDLQLIKDKALQKGFITKEKSEKMSDSEIANLIFYSGLSTTEKVSDISGRGVGMDVVRNNIERLNGTVAIESIYGEGTRFSLRLPLTLAIIPAMIIGIGDRKFAVPQINLEEIVQLDAQHPIEDIRGTSVLRLRGSLLPLVDLEMLLKMSERDTVLSNLSNKEFDSTLRHESEDSEEEEHGFVLVLKVENKRFGLLVDELFDNEEIVVKPLCSYLKNTLCYAGATLMGDGKVAMILDTDGIAKLADLCFSDFEQHGQKARSSESWQQENNEKQSLVLFRTGTDELLALSLSLVSRIEHIKKEAIQSIGNDEYLEYGDSSLRLIRLDRYMPLKPAPKDLKEYFVLVPQLVKKPMGILASHIEDVIEASVRLDEETIRGKGVLGSAILNNHLTIFLDLYNLFEHVDPQSYKTGNDDLWPDTLLQKRLLVAEDAAFFRTIAYNYLKPFFQRVDVVPDGAFAWEKLNLNNYDLVLTDLEMPNMNGFQLLESIRGSERLNKIPVVALTAFSNPSDVQKGFRAGFDAYETKFNKDKILKTLKGLLLKTG